MTSHSPVVLSLLGKTPIIKLSRPWKPRAYTLSKKEWLLDLPGGLGWEWFPYHWGPGPLGGDLWTLWRYWLPYFWGVRTFVIILITTMLQFVASRNCLRLEFEYKSYSPPPNGAYLLLTKTLYCQLASPLKEIFRCNKQNTCSHLCHFGDSDSLFFIIHRATVFLYTV